MNKSFNTLQEAKDFRDRYVYLAGTDCERLGGGKSSHVRMVVVGPKNVFGELDDKQRGLMISGNEKFLEQCTLREFEVYAVTGYEPALRIITMQTFLREYSIPKSKK